MAHGDDTTPGGSRAAFSVVRHGYDRTEVNRYFQQLEAGAQHAAAEREYLRQQNAALAGQLEAARREVAALTERLDTLARDGGDTREDHGARSLAVARSQASEITTRAQAAAEHSWAAAEQASGQLRERYQGLLADLDQRMAEIQGAHQSILDSARGSAEELTTAAERRRREIDAEAERDRIRIDREFSDTMRAKRDALTRELEAARAASATEADRRVREAAEEASRRVHEASEEADRRVREASQEADRRLAAATADVDRLTTLRVALAAQLTETHQLVEQVTASIAPLDQEMSFEDTLLFPPPVPHMP